MELVLAFIAVGMLIKAFRVSYKVHGIKCLTCWQFRPQKPQYEVIEEPDSSIKYLDLSILDRNRPIRINKVFKQH